MKQNMIKISRLQFSKENKKMPIISSYGHIEYGNGIRLKETETMIKDEHFHHKEIQLCKMKKNYVSIVMDKHECIEKSPDTHVIESSFRKHGELSGLVLLFFARLSKKEQESNLFFNNKLHSKLKFCKSNIFLPGKSNHFDSSGYYYSFGNRASYKKQGSSSINTYTNKKSKIMLNQNKIDDEAKFIENKCATELCKGIKSLKGYTKNITELISPMLDVSYSMQKKYGDINFTDVPTSKSGMWQSQVCVNASTSILHTENDCTYTCIYVPQQEFKPSKKQKKENMFIFSLNKSTNITILLENGCSFLFSGTFLAHRQNFTTDIKDGDYFYNLASYGNKRLFSHLRQSFKREIFK